MRFLTRILVPFLLASAPCTGISSGEAPVNLPEAPPAPESPSGVAKIRFLSETENLGDIPQGESPERIFVFYNDGDATLQILEVRSS